MFMFMPKRADAEDVGLFPEFVAAMERHGRLTTVHFEGAPFGGDGEDGGDGSSPRSDDLERLFGSVLPSLPLLRYASFERSPLHPRWARLLFSALPADRRPPLHLRFEHTKLPPESCLGIAGAIRRGALSDLIVRNYRLEPDGAAALLRAAGESRRLRTIELTDRSRLWEVTEATWAGTAAGSWASVRSLVVSANWADGGLSGLLRQLRVNASLERLVVRGHVDVAHLARLLEELLSQYNFSIARIGGDPSLPRARGVAFKPCCGGTSGCGRYTPS